MKIANVVGIFSDEVAISYAPHSGHGPSLPLRAQSVCGEFQKNMPRRFAAQRYGAPYLELSFGYTLRNSLRARCCPRFPERLSPVSGSTASYTNSPPFPEEIQPICFSEPIHYRVLVLVLVLVPVLVRAWMAKYDAADRQASGEPVPEDIQQLLGDLIASATSSGEVLDI